MKMMCVHAGVGNGLEFSDAQLILFNIVHRTGSVMYKIKMRKRRINA